MPRITPVRVRLEVAEIIRGAHDQGALVLIDGAQAVAHLDVDVQSLDCDFYAFSSHKMFGPTGMGVLFGKQHLLEAMPPWQGGGEMIEHVSMQRSSFNRLPYKYEAGTPNIAGAIGLGAARNDFTNVHKVTSDVPRFRSTSDKKLLV